MISSRVAAQTIRILLKSWIIKTPTSSLFLLSRSWLTGPWLFNPYYLLHSNNEHSLLCLCRFIVAKRFALVLSSSLITSSSWDCIWRMQVSCAEADLGYRHGNISECSIYIVQKDENKRLLLTASPHILLTYTLWQFIHIKVHSSIWLFNKLTISTTIPTDGHLDTVW